LARPKVSNSHTISINFTPQTYFNQTKFGLGHAAKINFLKRIELPQTAKLEVLNSSVRLSFDKLVRTCCPANSTITDANKIAILFQDFLQSVKG